MTRVRLGRIPELGNSLIERFELTRVETNIKRREGLNEDIKRNFRDKNKNTFNSNKRKCGGNTSNGLLEFPACSKCNKKDSGTCLMGGGVCYSCGKPEHIAKDCPHAKGQDSKSDKGDKKAGETKTKARVFAMTEEDAKTT